MLMLRLPFLLFCVACVGFMFCFILYKIHNGAFCILRQAGADRGTGTCIPQDEKADQAARKDQLAAAQKEYEWDTTVRNDLTYPTCHTVVV